jgi:hypothetical protein
MSASEGTERQERISQALALRESIEEITVEEPVLIEAKAKAGPLIVAVAYRVDPRPKCGR